MLQDLRETLTEELPEVFNSDEENSTFNRMKSRRWLQSTEMEYED